MVYCWKVISLWHFFSFFGENGVGLCGVVIPKGLGDVDVIALLLPDLDLLYGGTV